MLEGDDRLEINRYWYRFENNFISSSHLYKYYVMRERMHSMGKIAASLVAASGILLAVMHVAASSHREAPLIAADPKADGADLYAFVSPDKPDTATLIATYTPFQEPNGGPNFYTFDDNVRYDIKVDSDGDGVEDVTYRFKFNTTVGNKSTFLYNVGPVKSLSDANLNVKQTYTLTRITKDGETVLGSDLPVAPSNIGKKSMPDYAALSKAAVKKLDGGTTTFAGQVDDPFFVELGGIFDLLTIRKLPGNMGGGVDGLAGYNVNAVAVQVPLSDLTSSGTMPTNAADKGSVIGVWTTASRPSTRVMNEKGEQSYSGDYVQVSRLGAPLVNEVVVPLAFKDYWNGSKPKDDAQFANAVTDPEFPKLLKLLYGVKVPPQGKFGSPEQRDDLVAIFVTGIPGVTKPAKDTPAEELRLNLAIKPSKKPNRMGVLGGDSAGYPNGRRLADDVTDITIDAAAGAAYPLFHKTFKPDPLATKLGDGVDHNDAAFRGSFPYLALPWSGLDSRPHASNASLMAHMEKAMKDLKDKMKK